jgi:hypothetical protein
MPYGLTGTFDEDPATGGSCDSIPNNAVWFSYTPSVTGSHEIVLTNQSTTGAWGRLAVFEGAGCSPLGTELLCETPSTKDITVSVDLTQGQPYLILYHTDGESYTMVDPAIDIGPFTWDPGEVCSAAADVTGQTLPYGLTGTFDEDPATGGSCDSIPNNAVWFSYTPATAGFYQLSLENQSSTYAYGRLAVFEGTGCSPLGTELLCEAASTKNVTAVAHLSQGQPYLILYHTDGESYTMVDPSLDLTPVPYDPGEVCQEAIDLSAVTFPHAVTGTFDEDPAAGGSCDTTPTNAVWFTYTPATTGNYTVTAENQSTSYPYSRLAVFEGAGCSPLGTELDCMVSSSDTVSTTVTLDAGTPYLLLFHTDGDTYTMVDPIVDIQ